MTHTGSGLSWSVVLTTYNRSSLLKRAIESCVAQTEPCEIIVVDDCSSDETASVVAGFPRVIYIRNQTNLGHTRTANLGIERASGNWIKHLDDDDYLHAECLRGMSEAIAKAHRRGYDPKIITCVSLNVDADEVPISTTRTLPITSPVLIEREHLIRVMMLDQAPFGTPVQVGHERRAALAAGGWNEKRPIKFRNGDESEFWIRLGPYGDAIFMPDMLAYRTLWSGNEAPSHLDRLDISLYLKARVFERLNGLEDGSATAPRDIARYLDLHWGLVALKDKKLSTGLKLTLRGMFYPKSYRYIWRRSRFADAMTCARPLD
jgi:glycosyltransferase involved in cell wall biosynthesis